MRPDESALFKESLPTPHGGHGFHRQWKAQLMRQHANLSAMMRVMRDHVGDHGNTRRPGLRPSVALEVLDLPLRTQGFTDHLSTKPRAPGERKACLPRCASAAVELRRKRKMGCGEPQPLAADVLHVSKYCRDRAGTAARRLRPPGSRIKFLQDDLVHPVVDRISLGQCLGNVIWNNCARHIGSLTTCRHRDQSGFAVRQREQ